MTGKVHSQEGRVIWPAKQHPSVFITQTANTVLTSIPEAVAFLQDRYAS